jgi:hypothetical protein
MFTDSLAPAEWSFSTADADSCDLLLCDVDTETGVAAWQRSATRTGARAAATVGFLTSGGLTLNKDFYIDFPKGLRSHQIRLEGGDCSTDSFCYPSV